MEAKGNGSRQNWEREEENGGRKKKKEGALALDL